MLLKGQTLKANRSLRFLFHRSSIKTREQSFLLSSAARASRENLPLRSNPPRVRCRGRGDSILDLADVSRLKEDPLPPTNILGGDFELAGAQHLIRMKKSHKTHFRGDLSKKPAATLFLVGGNKSVKDEARSRGIKVMQQQEDSNAFDLKWTLGHADIDFGKLASSQFVNHFPGTASELGAKVGLNRNLKSLRWFDGMEVDSFFPRMYNLYNPWELQGVCEPSRAERS